MLQVDRSSPDSSLGRRASRQPLATSREVDADTTKCPAVLRTVLADRYPEFADALAAGRVGHHFMVGRGDGLPRDDALTAATMEHFRGTGFSCVIVAAAKQWTGAACETLGGVRVHFSLYRTQPRVPINGEGTTSPDGFLSDKDSGCMLYLHRLPG